MSTVPRWVFAAVGLVALTTLVLFMTSASGMFVLHPTVRHITIDASQFEYSPSTITVNQGDVVQIQLVSDDVTHGFYLDSYGVSTVAPPGHPNSVQFTADRAGTFRFRCSHTCGPLHPFMIGQLTITPASRTNPGPFAASGILAIVMAVGTVVGTWRSSHRLEARNA